MATPTPKAIYVIWNQVTLVSQSFGVLFFFCITEFKGSQNTEATKQGVRIFLEGKWQLLKSWKMDVLRGRSSRKKWELRFFLKKRKVKDENVISFNMWNMGNTLICEILYEPRSPHHQCWMWGLPWHFMKLSEHLQNPLNFWNVLECCPFT